MTGTASQVEWAELIKPRVGLEFDRVADALRAVAARQQEPDRTETALLISVVEEKRSEVMGIDKAGYFIRDWQELSDQVRQMLAKDPRFQVIRDTRMARRNTEKIPQENRAT